MHKIFTLAYCLLFGARDPSQKSAWQKEVGELARLINQVETKWRLRGLFIQGAREVDVLCTWSGNLHTSHSPWTKIPEWGDEIIFHPSSGKSRPHFTLSPLKGSLVSNTSRSMGSARWEWKTICCMSPLLNWFWAGGLARVHCKAFILSLHTRRIIQALLTRFRCNFACSQPHVVIVG